MAKTTLISLRIPNDILAVIDKNAKATKRSRGKMIALFLGSRVLHSPRTLDDIVAELSVIANEGGYKDIVKRIAKIPKADTLGRN